MTKLILGILALCTGLVLMTVGGYLAKDGWASLFAKKAQPEIYLRVSVDLQKQMLIQNFGGPVTDVRLFATRYVLDETFFLAKRIVIKSFSKIGGALASVPKIDPSSHEIINLTDLDLLAFGEDPGAIIDGEAAAISYYCLRLAFKNAETGEPNVEYFVTSGYKNFPSMIDTPESTGAAGGRELDFLYDVPQEIISHQKRLYQDR